MFSANAAEGFTLVELIVTLSVAGIILAIALPSFSGLVQRNLVTTQVNDFVTAANLTRSEAIRRGQRVTLCPSDDGASCATAGNWDQGWIVFVDPDNDATVGAGEEIVRVRESLQGGSTFVGNANVSAYISYVANGSSQLTSGAFQAGTVTLCNDSRGIDVVLSRMGRVRAEGVTCP